MPKIIPETMSARMLTVAELPDGYAKECFTEMVIDPTKATVWVVAKKGIVEDWACYIGFPTADMLRPELRAGYAYQTERLAAPGDVMERGDKVTEPEALALFPEWCCRRYRR